LSQKDKGRGLYRILAGSRAAEIDRKAIADGIDSKKLMKNAGTGAAEEIVFDYAEEIVFDYPVFVKYPILQYNPEDSGYILLNSYISLIQML